MKLRCEDCDLPQPSLTPVWGGHHGRFRLSIYICEGYDSHQGCGQMGVEVYDHEEDTTRLYGCIGKEKTVTHTNVEDE